MRRVVVELVDRQGKDGIVFRENGGGAVTVVHVRVDHHRLSDGVVVLQPPDGHGDIVNRAETLAMAGIRVMKATTDIAAKAVSQGGLTCRDGAARQPARTPATNSGEYGTSSFICSLRVRVPVFSLCTQSAVCTRRMSSSAAGSGRTKSSLLAMPSAPATFPQ